MKASITFLTFLVGLVTARRALSPAFQPKMQPITALVASVLALSIGLLPVTTAAKTIEGDFCDWETSLKLDTIRNGPLRHANAADWETDSELETLLERAFSPANPDDSRVLNVDVYMHVVGQPEGNASSEFLLDRNVLIKQLDVLNESFKPANISFTLSSIDWTKGALRVHGRSIKSQLAKDLYKGNLSALNVLFVKSSNTHGGSTMFNWGEKEDGCIINADTVPGGPHPVWNMGKTTVHEVGHWFGLLHTDFTKPGDCEPNWQNITGQSNNRCGDRCDSNYMSYGADECLLEFTSEQIKRMRKVAIEIRGL